MSFYVILLISVTSKAQRNVPTSAFAGTWYVGAKGASESNGRPDKPWLVLSKSGHGKFGPISFTLKGSGAERFLEPTVGKFVTGNEVTRETVISDKVRLIDLHHIEFIEIRKRRDNSEHTYNYLLSDVELPPVPMGKNPTKSLVGDWYFPNKKWALAGSPLVRVSGMKAQIMSISYILKGKPPYWEAIPEDNIFSKLFGQWKLHSIGDGRLDLIQIKKEHGKIITSVKHLSDR